MTAESILLAILLLPAFAGGILLAHRVIDRKHGAARRRIAEDMTRQVRERYLAYLELEAQIKRIFARFDQLEAQTARSLQATGVHLRTLDAALTAVEGTVGATAPGDVGSALDWMSAQEPTLKAAKAVPPAPAVREEQRESSGSPGWPRPEPEGLVQWEKKFETLREEKRLEIERQGQVIAALTERLQRLQPLDERPRQAEKELELWQEKYMRIEHEGIAAAAALDAQRHETQEQRERALALEAQLAQVGNTHEIACREKDERIAQLTTQAASLEPHAAAAEEARRESRQWSDRFHAEVESHELEVEDLRGRIGQLEPLRDLLGSAQAERETLRQSLSARELELSALNERLDDARGQIYGLESGERARLEQMAGLEERSAGLQATLAASASEVERLQGEVGACSERASSWERRCAGIEEERGAEIARLTARMAALEPLANRISGLEGLVAAYETRETASRGTLAELEGDRQRLSGELGEAQRRLEHEAQVLEATHVERDGLERKLEALRIQQRETAARLLAGERSLEEAGVLQREGELHHAAEVEGLRQRLRQAEQVFEGTRGDRGRLEQELEVLRGLQRDTAARLLASERSLEEAGVLQRELEQGYAAELAEHQYRHEGILDALEEARARVEALEAEKSQQQERMRDLEVRFDHFASCNEGLQRDLAAARAAAEQHEARVGSLSLELDEARSHGETMRRAAHLKGSLVEAAESVLAELRPKLEALEAQLQGKHQA